MKIKLNWGTGIVIAMALFMTFILQYVYRAVSNSDNHYELVSEDYYKDELYYQQEINKINDASKLDKNVTVKRIKEGFLVTFPINMDVAKIKGNIYFQRPSDKNLDFEQDISLKEHKLLIKHNNLVAGKWNVRVDWKYEDEEYLLKETVFY